MKAAFLFHGTGGSNEDYFWFADTKNFLEGRGYSVWWPLLPNTDKPELVESREFIQNTMPAIDEESIIIGHSSACPLILDLLQKNDIRVKQVVLVSGFYSHIDDDGYSKRMLPESFDWETIKSRAKNFVVINSDNDPWGCSDIQARPTAIALGATLIVPTGEGHMGSISFGQPYYDFTLLKRIIFT
jgi:predicted alpha/beta hydrolase family esterase